MRYFLTNKYFCRVSGSFQCGQTVPRREYQVSWSLDPFSTDAVETCSNVLLRLVPHDAVNVCFPEEVCELW